MIVQGSDGEATREEASQNRVHLGMRQNEVAHDHHLIAHRLKRRPRTEREGRFDRDAIEGDRKIAPGKREPVHAICRDRAGSTKRRIDLAPVRLRHRRGWQR